MKNKLSALIISAFAAASAFAAGDIYEIRPCTQYGLNASAYATVADPLGSGTSNLYFNVRLQLRGKGTDPNRDALKRWFTLNYWNEAVASKSEIIYASENSPLKIGIYVSGQLRTAKLENIYPNAASGTNFFDCVFVYKPQAGDFAMPVRLAVEDADGNVFPADESDSFSKYHFENSGIWSVNYHDNDDTSREGAASWKFSAASDVHPSGKRPDGETAGYTPEDDCSLKQAGIYVKTVDFDQYDDTGASNWDDPTYWREVAKGAEKDLTVVVDAKESGAAADTTLYVWSMDESAVQIVDGETVAITTNVIGGVALTMDVQVGTLTIKGGNASADFTVYGVESNRIATLVLSPWKGFKYSKYTGEKLLDFAEIPVKCGQPPVPSVQLSFDPEKTTAPSGKKLASPAEPSTNFNNRASEKIPLYVTLSKPAEKDVEVQIKVQYEANAALDPITNRFMAISANGDEFSESDVYATNVTFTVAEMNAGTLQKTLYIYPLGGNPDTKSQGIGLYPVLPDPEIDALYTKGDRVLLQINSLHAPVIWIPKADTDYGVVSGALNGGFDVSLLVNDCYRDMKNTNGFTVTFGGALKSQPATNLTFTAGESLDLTLTGYDKKKEGVQTGTIKVAEPAEPGVTPKTATVQITFTVSVEEEKTIELTEWYDVDGTEMTLHSGSSFKEGGSIVPKFSLSGGTSTDDLYVFLIPQNAASSNLVESKIFTKGYPLYATKTETENNDYFQLSLLDGCAETDGSEGQLSYQVVVSSDQNDPTKVDSTFTPTPATVSLSVKNVHAETKKMYIANNPTAVSNGGHYKTPISCGVTNSYVASVSDVSQYDVTNGIYVIWNFSDGYDLAPEFVYLYTVSSNETVECLHAFETEATTQTVQCVALDKDMLKKLGGVPALSSLSTLWPKITDMVGEDKVYKVTVYVSSSPYIKLVNGNELDSFTIDENMTSTTAKDENNKLLLTLSEPAKVELTVKISVKSYSDYTDPRKTGTLVFNTDTFTIKKGKTTPSGEIKELKYSWGNLDGAAGSMDAGFYVKAEVITSGYSKYYLPGEAEIFVNNMPPVISPAEPANQITNRVTVGEKFTLAWSANDVVIDLTNGLTAKWFIDGSEQAGKTVTGITSNGEYKTELSIGSPGLHTVTLAVYDKDGENYNGRAERNWLYYLNPVKQAILRPVGPTLQSKSRYKSAPGLGLGRVYAKATGVIIEDFVHTYNCDVNSDELLVYAAGYAHNYDADGQPLAYPDDGSLTGGKDYALDPDGNTWSTGGYYEYDGRYDNFFYCWNIVGGSTSGSTNVVLTPVFDTVSGKLSAPEQMPLDAFVDGKTSYNTSIREAIFSRELYESDNLGDINGDGIPDNYVQLYTGFGVVDDNGELVGNDIDSIALDNTDGDYFPQANDAIFPGLSNSWMTAANDFTALDEIRGYDYHLNHALDGTVYGYPTKIAKLVTLPDVKYVMPVVDADTGVVTNGSTLSELEYGAFVKWCENHDPVLDPADEANWAKWTPECPSDPTDDDTDNDGVPDGYEYYFWYRAHVGDPAQSSGTNAVKMTGRRYVVAKPGEPETITAAEIEATFNPNQRNLTLDGVDTDNDGITDAAEYALGTNPFDFDTDRDGLPDGYEILCSETDPLKYSTDGSIADGSKNPDCDAMAYLSSEAYMIPAFEINEVNGVPVTNAFNMCAFEEFDFDPATGKLETEKSKAIRFYRTWVYGVDGPLARGRDLGLGAEVTNVVADISAAAAKTNVVEIHYQVYHRKSFDPRTAWNVTDLKPDPVDTRAYYTSDEHLLLGFWINEGILTEAEYTPTKELPLTTIWQKYTTACIDAADADTDADGIPDGWELYTMAGPQVYGPGGDEPKHFLQYTWSPLALHSPLFAEFSIIPENLRDPDSDTLYFQHEFSGVTSVAAYSDPYVACDTVLLCAAEWRNKLLPSDPWNADTDGDGLNDGTEGEKFLYGSDGTAGGGLNPLSWDTDGDLLPDPWEAEFAGTYSNGVDSVSTSVGEDGTTNTTATSTGAWNDNGMDGTVNDAKKDYDHDGLLNWQEYMVGAMRHFRYDDSVSQWGTSSRITEMPDPSNDEEWGKFWYRTLIDPVEFETDENGDPQMVRASSKYYNRFIMLDQGLFDAGMAYFSQCTNEWDSANGKLYMFKDGIYHDLNPAYKPANMYCLEEGGETYQLNRYFWKLYHSGNPNLLMMCWESTAKVNYPKSYICCDPMMPDTDGDGMDDYYELFHGLNPLLGASGVSAETETDSTGLKFTDPRDVVWQAYDSATAPTAGGNWWNSGVPALENDVESRAKNGHDFVNFPWLAGLADADVDGDDARNYEEAIMANVQAASTYFHTDPTPLWMTDTSYSKSLTTRYYMTIVLPSAVIQGVTRDDFTFTNPYTGEQETHKFDEFPGLKWTEDGQMIEVEYADFNNWKILAGSTMFDFEQNEGYDSDHDFLSDSEERIGKTKSASDPQDHDDPLRRQAMWFGGKDEPGFLETPLAADETPSDKEGEREPCETFEFFTAECWAKPDASTYNQSGTQVVLERSIYTGTASANDSQFIRKNFIIGIRDGRWFGGFDSAGTAQDRIELQNCPLATTNWTHVALSYDGATLTFFMNGVPKVSKTVGRHPEHGLSATCIDNTGAFIGVDSPKYSSNPLMQPLAVFMVGGSVTTVWGHKFDYCNPLVHWTNIEDYGDFFRGYVDEVRVWDGARTASEIKSDYLKRYTAEDALENRESVYEKWVGGANRIESNVNGTLPAQLMYHWTFDHTAGAVDAADVIKAPAGFSTDGGVTDAKAVWSRPKDWTSPWRGTFEPTIESTVYTDETYIPWINDNVSHLPRFDGSTDDSCYWNEGIAGFTTAASLGYKSFAFNRSHEVYSHWTQLMYEPTETPLTTSSRWENLQQLGGEIDKRVSFTYRNRHTYGDDMLPFGSAFARRISASEGGMWDGQGAADAWAQTGDDSNNDGLPDWWVQYARENYYEGPSTGTLTWNTPVIYDGQNMLAWQAYKRDLAKGAYYKDGEIHFDADDYGDTRDLDSDGMYDWWEDLYGIDTGSTDDALADPDNDGLSNYQEYLSSQKYGWYVLNPTLARSFDGQEETDYFLRLDADLIAEKLADGNDACQRAGDGMYLGEVLADHDFLEDNDEQAIGTDHTKYDAYSDNDEDGWTAFSEARYSAFKQGISARFVSHMNGTEEVTDAPVPVVHLTTRYNGETEGTNTIVVEAYSGNNLQKQANASYSFTTGAAQTRQLNLGTYEDRVIHGTLAPGHILAGEDNIKLQFFFIQNDQKFSWTITTDDDETRYTGTYAEMISAMATYGDSFKLASQAVGWNDLVTGELLEYTDGASQVLQIAVNEETQRGDLLLAGKKAGEIDLLTGDFDLDLSSIGTIYVQDSSVQLSQCFFRIEYQSILPVQQTKALTVSLGKPDSGKLTEGSTAFVAYMDKDGDGAFTPDTDPIGFAKDVQVGWDNVPELVIEMTDSSQAAGKRFSIPDDAATIRIIRTTMNGEESVNGADVKRRIVYSRTASDVARKNVYEADLVTSGKFGLDWTNLRNDIEDMSGVAIKDITSVGYVVVTNTGSVMNIAEADVLDSFTIEYAAEATKPTCVSPTAKTGGIVETQRPTFKWTAADGYTAFRIQIGDKSGADWFYDSGMLVLPARNANSQYVWTAPVYIGTNVCDDITVLSNNSNYTWRVAMYNAKFSSTNSAATVWSNAGAFTTALAETNDRSTEYGSAKVTVKYFGPATNGLDEVVVDLYKTADFTGTPAARTRLFAVDGKVDALTNGSSVAFHGLEDGDYYAVAFIDRNGNGTRDNWETWGYAAQIGANLSAIWTPVAVTVDATKTEIPSVTLYMEDTDINQNDVLDIYDDEDTLKSATETTSTGADTTDVDGDGLTADDETSDTYTDKAKWDTDGDGMPDGWEARFAGTDPLTADADTVADGDLMAFAVTSGVYRLVMNAAGEQFLIRDEKGTNRVADVLTADRLITTYDYETIVADDTGTNFVKITYQGLGTNLVDHADFEIDSIAEVAVALVHAQVYDEFGYSQGIAIDPSDELTKPFTAIDKYMLARYFEHIGIRGVDEAKMNGKDSKSWEDYTLKPLDTDNDRDGVADGWELYLMFGTNGVKAASTYASLDMTPINPWTKADRNAHHDSDTLTLVDEYSQGRTPSNPWNEQSVYDELIKNEIISSEDVPDPFLDDKVKRHFDLSKDAYDLDNDGDQIKNAQEMWAYYRDLANLEDIDINNAFSDGTTPDYFRRCGSSYLGEMYNGAEFFEFAARENLELTGTSRVGTRDYFQSGWDVWSLVRFNVAKSESTDSHTKLVNYFIKYLSIRWGEEFTGTTEAEAIEFQNSKCNHQEPHQTIEECINCTNVGGIDYIKQLIAENGTSTLTSSEYDIPDPTVYLTLKYAGNDSQELVVEAYQVSSTYPEYGEQMVARWAQNVLFDSGIAYAKLELPGKGSLKQGRTRFIAYFDTDSESGFTHGDTYGEATLNVGYMGASGTIRMGEKNLTGLPAVRLGASTNGCSTIVFVRSAINGKPLYNSAKGVFAIQFPNNAARELMHPADYDLPDYIGIDNSLSTRTDIDSIESVTYEVLRLHSDDLATLSISNLNHYAVVGTNGVTNVVDNVVNEEITFLYSNSRDVAGSISVAGSTIDDLTLTFTMPKDGYANTKFWLNVWTNDVLKTYGDKKGFVLVGDAQGRVILDKEWFSEHNVVIPQGKLAFSVDLGNDKFGKPVTASNVKAETFVNAGANYAGQIMVSVTHPTNAVMDKLTVAVYTKEDLAQPYRTVTGCSNDTCVVVSNLVPGASYYVAAWNVKNASDGRSGSSKADATIRMPYDTWGYLTKLGVATNGFSAALVAAKAKPNVTNVIYVQDTDFNANGIIDCAETFIGLNGIYSGTIEPTYNFDIQGIEDVEIFSDAAENDVFAYATVPYYCVATEINGEPVWFAVTNCAAEEAGQRSEIGVVRGAPLSDLKTLMTTYYYDYGSATPKRLALGTNVTDRTSFGDLKVTDIAEAKSLVLVHAQVYTKFGFHPNTANGYISSGTLVNTKSFTSADKNYVTNYLANVLGVRNNVTSFALPIDYPDADSVVGGRGDGVLDGWELYVMFNANGIRQITADSLTGAYMALISPWNYSDRNYDHDDDGLDLIDEYNGGFEPTDPWNKYSVYENFKSQGLLLEDTPEFKDGDARRFGVTEDTLDADTDNDQLTNLEEMQAYYLDKANLVDLSVTNAWSNGATPDYFRACGSTYLGALFNGGEWIEDDMRTALGMGAMSMAGTRDYNESGWDYWSMSRNGISGISTNIVYVLTNDAGRVAMKNDKTISVISEDRQLSSDYDTWANWTIGYVSKATIDNANITPDVNLTLKYAGNAAQTVVVEAYQVNSAYPEEGQQLTAQWTVDAAFDSGVAKVTLDSSNLTAGSLKQGAARFVAYIDVDGDGVFSAADCFGETTREIGYLGTDATIRMAEPNVAAFPILRSSMSNDCNVVALVRSQVNGQILYGGKKGWAREVYYVTLRNNKNWLADYPAEWIRTDYIGIDSGLSEASDYELGTNKISGVASVTYEVIYLNNTTQAKPVNAVDLNHYVVISNDNVTVIDQQLNDEITIYYSLTRDIASALAVANGTGDDYSFSFKMPDYGKANTKFWLKVNDVQYPDDNVGYPLKTDAEGLVVLDKSWFDEKKIPINFGKENTFQVALGNDKYPKAPSEASDWSSEAKFIVGNAANYNGQIVVQVKHPTEPDATFNGKITVAAYETADLANPVAVKPEYNTSTPIVIDGLRVGGEYYIAAWSVANDEDGRSSSEIRRPYDTWGYICNLTVSNKTGIAKSPAFDAVTVAAAKTATVTNDVWMQDTDFNDNGIVDRSENDGKGLTAIDGLLVTGVEPNFVDWTTGDPGDINTPEDEDDDEAETATSVDVMAYAKVPFTCVAIQVPKEEDPTEYDTIWYAVTDVPVGTNVTSLGIAVGTPLQDLTSLATTYRYGSKLGLGTNLTISATNEYKVVDVQTKDLVLVHAQVYDYFGYNANTANGEVESGERVNTKDVTSTDKTSVTNYLVNVLGVTDFTAYTLPSEIADGDPVEGGLGDGILDGWELYTMFAPDGEKDGLLTKADGSTLQITGDSLTNDTTGVVQLSPWNYNDRNQDADGDGLSNLLEYDGGYAPTDPSNKDTDNDGITDYYAQQYMLKGDEAGTDYDGDGLSNYAEYLISEVFQYAKLDPCDPKTDGSCIDYFRKMGELYFGEIFTDHDQTDDLWEDGFADAAADGAAYANRYIYDPNRDADNDGWSNYAEAKAGTNPELVASVGVDGYTYAEHPVPMIEAHVTYNGRLNAIVAPLVFKAWNESADADMVSAPDAIWTVAASSTATDSGSADTATESDSGKSRSKYLGVNPKVTRKFALGPGAVTPGSVRIYFRDQGWQRAVVRDGVEIASYVGDTSAAKWHALVQDVNGILCTCVTNDSTVIEVGTIDYTTGRITVDFDSAALTRSVYATMNNASANQSGDTADTTSSAQYYNCEKLNLAQSYVKVEWTSTVVGTSVEGTYYLGDADTPGTDAATSTRGYVREGKSKFVVFADLDSSGEYTAGEPFGFVYGVDIGWQGAKFSVDLTDTHPVFARISLKDGSNDRVYWDSMSSTIVTNEYGLGAAPSGNVRVRVVRTALNGINLAKNEQNLVVPQEVVMDKTFNTSIRPYLHEGDFLTSDSHDIDWSTLSSHLKEYTKFDTDAIGVTSVTYRIVFGDGAISTSEITNNATLKYTVDRRYDMNGNTVGVSIDRYGSVTTYNTRPTFRWAVTSGGVNFNSYDAFKVEVLAADGTTVLYDSGIRPVPGYEVVEGYNYYTWTAPSVVDNLLSANGRIVRNGTYKWRVTVYNAKFVDGKQSGLGTLTTAVNVTQDANDHEYSAIPVAVKYTGPSAVLEKVDDIAMLLGKVRVQAFATADFSGDPISEAIVTNATDIADASHTTANGKLYGLPANGQYYLRAYIDSNGNLKKDEWESWGAAATVVTAGSSTPTGIWIEDADTDDDWLPDAWEFAKNNWKGTTGWLNKRGKDVSGEFIVNQTLYNSVTNTTLSAGVSTGMSGASLTVFTYDEVAGLVCGGTGYSFDSVDDIRKAVQKKVQADTLKITSITLDPTGSKVVIGVGAEVADTIAGRLINKIYDFNTSATLTVKIYARKTLAEDWGVEPVCTKTVTVSKNLDTLVEVPVDGVDMSSGFYKVVVEQE